MTIDIICPLYNAENYIDKLHASFEMQENVNLKTIRYVITKGTDNTEEKVKNLKNCKYRVINPEEFSHGGTREEEAFDSDADIIVFVTQDVIIERKDWLEKLTKPIEDGEVDQTYSRQISKSDSIEKYTREKNYPKESRIVSKNDIEELGLNTFFSSDASAAIKRETFVKLKGYDGKKLQMSEDMYFTHKLIMNGYKVKYCSDSEVIHSHNFTLKQVYNRYKDTGKFFKENPYLDEYKTTKSGGNLAKYILKRAWQDKNWKALRRFLPDMCARYFGMKAGKR